MDDPVAEVEKILSAAAALIRRRLKHRGLEASHLILAVLPDGAGIIRSNVGPGGLTDMARMLKEVATEVEAPPGKRDTTH